MTRRVTITLPLLAILAALALLAPAGSFAAEEAPSTTQTETTTAPETTVSKPTPEPQTTPAAPPTTSSAVESAPPAPGTTTTTPEVTTTPQISGQRAQGSSPSPRNTSPSHTKSSAGAGSGAQGANPTGGSKAKLKRGRRAPKPSALTPALPLSLSSSIAGVPGFFIESFRIPPFLLPIYQAAGTAYGVPWQVLAAINEVETDYGRDLNVSSAGAEGWMQFLPSSWESYGVDANGDGFKDPYNPADAIFAAGRYLRAAGAATDVRGAIFSYNHSQTYVESVMLRAKLLGGTPSGLLGAITGLTEARFPVHSKAHFSDGFPTLGSTGTGPAKTLAGTTIYADPGAPVIAVQDGVVVQIGSTSELGHFISLRDAYGNTYTYAQLGSVAELYPVLRPHDGNAAEAGTAKSGEPAEPRPSGPASAGTHTDTQPPAGEASAAPALTLGAANGLEAAAPGSGDPAQPASGQPSSESPAPAGAATPDPAAATIPPVQSATPPDPATAPRVFRSGPNDVYLHPLRAGAKVIAGTVLGHVAEASSEAGSSSGASPEARMFFQIRPAGVGAPLIDPKPILDGWVQLENSSIFRAKGQNPFLANGPSAGQVLLESKEQLEQQVLANPGIDIYPCGRQDIQTGRIDRRVLATLEFLEVSGLKPTVSALECGHSELTTSGNVSEHYSGNALDISEINGTPIVGHQGPGSITDTTIRKLLTLQGSMRPHQIISLMTYPGEDNTLAMADHYNHIHVGFRPLFAESARLTGSLTSAITPSQWIKLIARLGEIPDPSVSSGPSAAAIEVHPSSAGGGK